jgi:hypothetical protein
MTMTKARIGVRALRRTTVLGILYYALGFTGVPVRAAACTEEQEKGCEKQCNEQMLKYDGCYVSEKTGKAMCVCLS